MEAVVMVSGLLLEAAAWWLVAFRRLDVWRVLAIALVGMGAAAILVGPPSLSPDVAPAAAAGVGAAAGVAFYAATRGFVAVVRRWERFHQHSVATYGRRGARSLGFALTLSVLVLVPGEELFWRGLFQPELVDALDGRAGLAAILGWMGFVAANLPSANLAIVAGAVVGGAVWTGLGWWSGGVLAPLVSHAAWTALMLAFPVVRAAEVDA